MKMASSKGNVFESARIVSSESPEKASGVVELEPGLQLDFNNAFDVRNVQCPSHTTESALIRRIDLKVMPVLVIVYLLAFLDRVNISNALIFGLTTDLKLKGNQINIALTMFFVPYVLFEIPSNLLLKRLKPHVWLSICMFLFGLVMTLQGVVQNYSGLIATRFFLGLFEAGVFPGCFYLISTWYQRREAQKRYTIFFSSVTLAAAFGGLLASAIGKMNGIRGYSGWRYIFILEGILTCVFAVVVYFAVADFPEEAKWLTEEERGFIIARLKVDQGESGIEKKATFRDVLAVFKDYKIFIGGLMYMGLVVPIYSYSYFTPTIIKTYGYGNIQTQLHSVAPAAAAFVFALMIAYLSDRTRHRFAFVVICTIIAIVGTAVLLNVHRHPKTEYAMLFLIAMGTFSAAPVMVCWVTMNFEGHLKRSVGTAYLIGFGNIGGFIATFSFQTKDAPSYHTGYSVVMAFFCLTTVTSGLYFIAVRSQNKTIARQAVAETVPIDEPGEEQHMHSGFTYML